MSAPTLVIRFGVLHDNLGEPKHNGTLIVRDGAIAAVTGSDALVPDGARVIEAPCVVPGLINAHVHLEMSGEAQTQVAFKILTEKTRLLAAAANARKTLLAGVTTVRDVGSTDDLVIELRDAINAGTHAGPTILAAARAICMTGGHGWFLGREADGALEVRKAVREQRRFGADCIKFIATGGVLTKGAVPGIVQLDEDELRAGIDEAHKHGMKCAAHAIGAGGIVNATRAGIDSIEHGHLIDDEGIAAMLERKTYLVPTLAAIKCILDGGEAGGMPDFVLRKAREIAVNAETNLRKALAAGVKFAGGSDAGTPFNYHESYAYEVELMQSMLGMTPARALRTTTVNSADLLGVQRGTLGQGDVADLVVLRSDITSDARPFRDPLAVAKAGVLAATV